MISFKSCSNSNIGKKRNCFTFASHSYAFFTNLHHVCVILSYSDRRRRSIRWVPGCSPSLFLLCVDQPYFRSSRASVWGCDSGKLWTPLAFLMPSRSPATLRLHTGEPSPSAEAQRHNPPAPRTNPSPGSSSTVLQSVGLTAFLWTVYNHDGWRARCVSRLAPVYVRVKGMFSCLLTGVV